MEHLDECSFVVGQCIMTDKEVERISAYTSFAVTYLLPLIALLLCCGMIRGLVGMNQRNERSVDLWAGIALKNSYYVKRAKTPDLWGAQFPGHRITLGASKGGTKWLRTAPKCSNNVTSAFFNTVNLLSKDLRFHHGGFGSTTGAPNLFIAPGAIQPRYAHDYQVH